MPKSEKYFGSDNEETDHEEHEDSEETDNEEHEETEDSDYQDSEMMDLEECIPTATLKQVVKDATKEAIKEVSKETPIKEEVNCEKLIMDLRKFYFNFEKCKDISNLDKKIIFSICSEITKRC